MFIARGGRLLWKLVLGPRETQLGCVLRVEAQPEASGSQSRVGLGRLMPWLATTGTALTTCGSKPASIARETRAHGGARSSSFPGSGPPPRPCAAAAGG